MSETGRIEINGHEIVQKEYKDRFVVTFKDIDTVHERPEGTAKRNFAQNKTHFIEGEDFFKISRLEFGTKFVPNTQIGNKKLDVILLTESGYLMLVKSLTDDLAWDVQRQLVNTYFHAKQLIIEPVFSDIDMVKVKTNEAVMELTKENTKLREQLARIGEIAENGSMSTNVLLDELKRLAPEEEEADDSIVSGLMLPDNTAAEHRKLRWLCTVARDYCHAVSKLAKNSLKEVEEDYI